MKAPWHSSTSTNIINSINSHINNSHINNSIRDIFPSLQAFTKATIILTLTLTLTLNKDKLQPASLAF